MAKILIIGSRESEETTALSEKMKAEGWDHAFVTPKQMARFSFDTKIFVLYMDEGLAGDGIALTVLNEKYLKTGRQLLVVGDDDECDVVDRYIDPDRILRYFGKPLEMEKLILEVEEYLKKLIHTETRKNILIVDDDTLYARMVASWLSEDYRVIIVSSGKETLAYLEGNRPDLILLDYEMPVMNGPAVLGEIRRDPKTHNLPVMFLTGKDDRQRIQRVIALDPVDYLVKTIDREGLMKRLEDFFHKRL